MNDIHGRAGHFGERDRAGSGFGFGSGGASERVILGCAFAFGEGALHQHIDGAAMFPVSKSSELVVPPKGMSRCVCTSMPPGIRSRPVASVTRPEFSVGSCAAMALTRSPVMPTSAR